MITDYKILNKFRSKTPKGFYDVKKGHTGIDLNMGIGTDIQFPFKTEMVSLKQQSEMGLTQYLKGPDGSIIVLAHLSVSNGPKGRIFEAGETVAKSGNSGGVTTGPHLHIEVIAEKPTEGLECMTRTLGEFSGHNVDPITYLNSLTFGSSEDLDWLKKHQVIFKEHKPGDPVTWGELAVVLRRLATRILEWIK